MVEFATKSYWVLRFPSHFRTVLSTQKETKLRVFTVHVGAHFKFNHVKIYFTKWFKIFNGNHRNFLLLRFRWISVNLMMMVVVVAVCCCFFPSLVSAYWAIQPQLTRVCEQNFTFMCWFDDGCTCIFHNVLDVFLTLRSLPFRRSMFTDILDFLFFFFSLLTELAVQTRDKFASFPLILYVLSTLDAHLIFFFLLLFASMCVVVFFTLGIWKLV